MGYAYFSVNEEKIIDSILSIAQNKYGIKGVKRGVIIPMHSEKMPYFISTCQLYFDDDDPNMRKTIETILNLTYDIHNSAVSALIYGHSYYVRTISIERNDYEYGGQLVFYSHSFNNLINIDIPSDSFVKWQIYEGIFKEMIQRDDVVEYVNNII